MISPHHTSPFSSGSGASDDEPTTIPLTPAITLPRVLRRRVTSHLPGREYGSFHILTAVQTPYDALVKMVAVTSAVRTDEGRQSFSGPCGPSSSGYSG